LKNSSNISVDHRWYSLLASRVQCFPKENGPAHNDPTTNLRAVRDEESSTGWTIEIGPFPGWAEVPEW